MHRKYNQQEQKIDKLNLRKLKMFGLQKILLRSEKIITEWKKIFINLISDKELTSRMCKELLELNNKEANYSA